MVSRKDSNKARLKRHKRVRAKISGTAARPRLAVYRSNANISAQIIDDVAGKTLVSASTYGAGFEGNGGNKAAAREIGKMIAEKAVAMGILEVVFDKGLRGYCRGNACKTDSRPRAQKTFIYSVDSCGFKTVSSFQHWYKAEHFRNRSDFWRGKRANRYNRHFAQRNFIARYYSGVGKPKRYNRYTHCSRNISEYGRIRNADTHRFLAVRCCRYADIRSCILYHSLQANVHRHPL